MKAMEFKKQIFGINITFSLSDPKIYKILKEELVHYPNSNVKSALTINDSITSPTKILSNNPKEFTLYDNGFLIKSKAQNIFFLIKNEKLNKIEFQINEKNNLLKTLRKFNDMQFSNRKERVGQILHEAILLPAMLLMNSSILIHASGFYNTDENITLIGGTGGVGKTSLELIACLNRGKNFVCDDIAVIENKIVYPNYNFPKIYGYNVEGKAEIKRKILAKRTFLNKVMWNVLLLRGKDKVRRRIDPIEFYGSEKFNDTKSIKKYLILSRSNVDSIELNDISINDAAILSYEIIKSEFSVFFKTLHFWNYNSFINEKGITFDLGQFRTSYLERFQNCFKNTHCYNAKLPLKMKHKDFLSQMENLFETNIL